MEEARIAPPHAMNLTNTSAGRSTGSGRRATGGDQRGGRREENRSRDTGSSKSKSKSKGRVNRRTAGRGTARESKPKLPTESLSVRLRLVRYRLGWFLGRLRAPLILSARLLSVATVFAGAVAAAHLIERHVRTSDSFATSAVEIEGLSRLDRTEIMRWTGLELGQNVFQVSASEAERRLLGHPWIRSASVERRLPGTYRIRVRENRPAALLSLGELYLVSDDAKVFKKRTEADPVDLPVITGIDRDRFTGDREYRTAVLEQAISLLHDYSEVGLRRREPIAEMHVQDDGGFCIYTGQDAVHVALGPPPFRSKLRRLRKVLDRLERKQARPAYVYLDNDRRPDRVTVRLR